MAEARELMPSAAGETLTSVMGCKAFDGSRAYVRSWSKV